MKSFFSLHLPPALQDKQFPVTLNEDLNKPRLTLENCLIYIDGTFQSCPLTFNQLYIIHVAEDSASLLFPNSLKKFKTSKKDKYHIVQESLFCKVYALRGAILTLD
ncbi:hypothetical protein MXB_2754, partial [Myxobolus squamalis]